MRPRPLARFALALPLALTLTACGSGGAGNFAGSYGGSWTVSTTAQGSTTSFTEGRMVTVTAATEPGADLLINLQTNSETACVLKATRSGDDATILTGQDCVLASGSAGIHFTVQSGTASLYAADGGVVSADGGLVANAHELIINLSGSTSGGSMTGVYDGVTR